VVGILGDVDGRIVPVAPPPFFHEQTHPSCMRQQLTTTAVIQSSKRGRADLRRQGSLTFNPFCAAAWVTGLKRSARNLVGTSRTAANWAPPAPLITEARKVVDFWGGRRNAAGEPWEEDTLVLVYSVTKDGSFP
jgi:hypothetical protein